MIQSNFVALALLATVAACSPAPETTPTSHGSTIRTGSQDKEESAITVKKIMRDVVGRVVMITEVNGDNEPTEWTFDADEFKQLEIVDREAARMTATITVFMTTRNNPKPDEEAVQVTGKLKLHYQRQGDKWVLMTIENLTFRYTVGVST